MSLLACQIMHLICLNRKIRKYILKKKDKKRTFDSLIPINVAKERIRERREKKSSRQRGKKDNKGSAFYETSFVHYFILHNQLLIRFT